MIDSNKSFAERWSQRKLATRQQEDTDLAVTQPEQDHVRPTKENENVDEAPLTEADFDDVDFETLDNSSDYTRFVRSNVPAAIQQKALRKLWESDSVFEVLDGMNDYDEDFTGNGLAGKVMKTAYKVGKGFVDKDEDVEIIKKKTSGAEPERQDAMQTTETEPHAEENQELQSGSADKAADVKKLQT